MTTTHFIPPGVVVNGPIMIWKFDIDFIPFRVEQHQQIWTNRLPTFKWFVFDIEVDLHDLLDTEATTKYINHLMRFHYTCNTSSIDDDPPEIDLEDAFNVVINAYLADVDRACMGPRPDAAETMTILRARAKLHAESKEVRPS